MEVTPGRGCLPVLGMILASVVVLVAALAALA
jgi:hypothetical protein